jgi:hypothetical protein
MASCARNVAAGAIGEVEMSGPTPDQFNLVVSDMEATVAFYRRVGLTIPDTDPEWQGHHRSAELADGIDIDFDSTKFATH